MIKFGCILVLLVLWLFATMLQVNNKSQNGTAFFWKSVFFWIAIGVAYSLGSMH
jgi:hypothetical protein